MGLRDNRRRGDLIETYARQIELTVHFCRLAIVVTAIVGTAVAIRSPLHALGLIVGCTILAAVFLESAQFVFISLLALTARHVIKPSDFWQASRYDSKPLLHRSRLLRHLLEVAIYL